MVVKFSFLLIVVSLFYSIKCRDLGLKIVGGGDVSISDVPYMALVTLHFLWKDAECGGSIIHEKFILTSANCLEEHSYANLIYVQLGIDDLEENPQRIIVDKVICHEDFVHTNFMIDNDICLLKLSQPVIFGKTASKINLPTGNDVIEGSMADVTGWGNVDQYGQITGKLQKLSIPVISNEECWESNENFLCAGEWGRGSCGDDDGGPLVQNGVQIGIDSHSINPNYCAVSYERYTRVSKYVTWIQENIKENL